MNVLVGLGCGAGIGAGLLLALRGAYPPRPSLADALAHLNTRTPTPPTPREEDRTVIGRAFGRPARSLAQTYPRLIPTRIRGDLAVVDRPPERQLAEKTALALTGLLLLPALTGLLALAGNAVPWAVPLWGSLLLAAVGFFIPDLTAHADAQARRHDFTHALGSYLDLVTVALAGGAGVETALHDAATIGTGWAYDQIRTALDRARLSRTTVWDNLGQLGTRLDIPALVELAATVGLAGTEGARVRASLTAKAASLRAHELAAAETEAQAATERMSLPLVVLFAGFLVFIGYPAVTRVLTGL